MKTWEDIKSVDELIHENEKRIISEIERELTRRCPHLRKIGESFYYCGGGIPEGTEVEYNPLNPIIDARQECIQLQLHCVAGYERCCHYKGTLAFPGARR